MNAPRRKIGRTPIDVSVMVDKLLSDAQCARPYIVGRGQFTRGQLLVAISKCRALCPGIEISQLCTWYDTTREETMVTATVPPEQAHAILAPTSLPIAPKRLNNDPPAPFDSIWRANGLIHFHARIRDNAHIHRLTHLTPSAIRAAAPEAPESEKGWRGIVEAVLRSFMCFAAPDMLRINLQQPVIPSSAPPRGAPREAVYEAANARFYLKREDIEHLVSLYTRRQAELHRELLASFGDMRTCGPGMAARMHLVVNGTPPQPRS
jgi:hypothetical protein